MERVIVVVASAYGETGSFYSLFAQPIFLD